MPLGDTNNYEKLKTALLQWYKLTEDGFRRKFRENKPVVCETVFQFVAAGVVPKETRKQPDDSPVAQEGSAIQQLKLCIPEGHLKLPDRSSLPVVIGA